MRRAIVPLLFMAACRPAEHHEVGLPDHPWFEIKGGRVDVGFEEPISLDVHANSHARSGEITWRQVSGPPLAELETTNRGFQLSARTPRLADLVTVPLPWSIVSLSPRTRGEIVLQA